MHKSLNLGISKIYQVRGKQVLLSQDLAELYEVETRVLNQQVKRNIGKFPERYMFQLTKDEDDRLRSQNVTLKRGQHAKYLPYAFTEHGILMLSSVLNSERADKVNMLIIDTFVKLRELMFMHKDVAHQLEKVHNKLTEHDSQIMLIFEYLKQLEEVKQQELEQKKRKPIGFKPPEKK
ncbi:MAG: ORF6N domain-containing protein [Bacteroidales bacterium]